MSTKIGDMVVRILGDNSNFDKSMDNVENRFKKASETLAKTGKSLTKFVTLPILGIAAASVKAAADMEMSEAAFTTMLGSAEAAKNMLMDLTTFASKTPFGLKDLKGATQTLLQFGVESRDIMPTLQAIGDVAGGNADRMKSLSLAYGQATSAGRLMGQDLLQMINAGFNPLQVIAEQTGETMLELKKRMEDGAISADELADAFKYAASEGGQFFGGMERGSQTLTGQLSTLKDEAVQLGISFGKVLLPALKDITQNLTAFAKRFSNFNDEQKKAIITFSLVAAAIGPVVLGVGKLVIALPKLRAGFILLKASVIKLNVAMLANPLFLAGAAVAAGILLVVSALNKAKKAAAEFAENSDVSYMKSLEENIIALEFFETQLNILKKGNEDGLLGSKYSSYNIGILEDALAISRKIVTAQQDIKAETEETAKKQSEADVRREASLKRIQDGIDRIAKKKADAVAAAVAEEKRLAEVAEQEQAVISATQKDIIRRAENIDGIIGIHLLTEIEGLKIKIKMRKDALELHYREVKAGLHSASESQRFTRDQNKQIDETAARVKLLMDAEAVITKIKDEANRKETAFMAKQEEFRYSAIDGIKEETVATEELVDATDELTESTGELSEAQKEAYDEQIYALETIKSLGQGIADMVAGDIAGAVTAFGNTVSAIGKESESIETVVAGEVLGLIGTVIGAVEQYGNQLVAVRQGIASRVLEIADMMLSVQMANLDTLYKAQKRDSDKRLSDLDDEEQAALEAAGYGEKTPLEEALAKEVALKKEVADLWAAGRRKQAIEAETELAGVQATLKRLTIEEEFATKRQKILDEQEQAEKDYLNARAQFEYQLAINNKAIKHAEIGMAEQAAISGVPLSWTKKGKESIASIKTQFSELEGIVSSISIPAPVLLAEGGVVMPKPGGTLAQIAEAGVPEVVLPLDRLESLFEKNTMPKVGDPIAKVTETVIPDIVFPLDKLESLTHLSTGGVVMPKVGGTIAKIAEAGIPEVVFPLDRLESFLEKNAMASNSEGMTHLQVMLDSKPILEKIFPASRNGTVLISARAVV